MGLGHLYGLGSWPVGGNVSFYLLTFYTMETSFPTRDITVKLTVWILRGEVNVSKEEPLLRSYWCRSFPSVSLIFYLLIRRVCVGLIRIQIKFVFSFMWVLTLIPPSSGARFEIPQYLTVISMDLELTRSVFLYVADLSYIIPISFDFVPSLSSDGPCGDFSAWNMNTGTKRRDPDV